MNSVDDFEVLLKHISRWSFEISAGIGILSLSAWLSGLLIIASVGNKYIPVAPSTAFCFLILSISALIYFFNPSSEARRTATQFGTSIVFFAALFLLANFLLGIKTDIEHFVVKSPALISQIPLGHMSPVTAATFLIATSSLWLLVSKKQTNRVKQFASILALAVSLTGSVVIVGYIYGTPLLYGGSIIPVALPTGVSFLLNGVGLLAASGSSFFPVRFFGRSNVQSRLLKAFLPITIVIVLIDGFVYKTALLRTTNPALISSVIAILSVIVVVTIVARMAQKIGGEIDRAHAERREAEHENRFLASIIQNLPNAVCAINENRMTTTWSKGAEKMFGYSAEEILGKPISMIIPKEIADAELNHCISVLDDRGFLSGYESARIRKDGRTIPVELSAVAIHDSDLNSTHYASFIVDTTDRKRAEEERLKRHSLESIGILAGGIAHDFNNLLAAIIGNVNMAKMSLQSDQLSFTRLTDAEHIGMMASELCKRLIMVATGGDPIREVVQIPELIRDTVVKTMEGSGIDVRFNLPENLFPVAADADQIKQVIVNLTTNAKEAMVKGGTLTIQGINLSVSSKDNIPVREGNYVKISFRDSGPGIPTASFARVFDPYYSTKDTYSQKGLGLGLAVCYSLIKKHDGLVTLESEPGKGTTFYIFLPATKKIEP